MAPAKKSSVLVFICLHVLLLVFSFSDVFSKLAAGQEFLSPLFIAFYGGVLALLGVFAIGWQQIIARMPLTVAYMNKAVTLVWGIIWGALFFSEQVSLVKVIGAVVIIAGIVLFAQADGEQASAASQATPHMSMDEKCAGENAGDEDKGALR